MTGQKKLFVVLIIGLLLVAAFGCSKDQKKEVKEQVTEKQPEKQAVQTQQAAVQLVNYKIDQRSPLGMEVSVPHNATKEQIERLNSKLKQMGFRNSKVINMRYHCLDHPDAKELIAEYKYNARDRINELKMCTPEDRYPDTMTAEEISKLNAEVEQENTESQ